MNSQLHNKLPNVILLLLIFLLFSGCNKNIEPTNSDDTTLDDTDFEIPDWSLATHSNDVDPDFAEVFEDDAVKRIDLVVSAERWQSMLDDMTDLYGDFGGRGGSPGGTFSDENPIFVPAQVYYNNIEWYRVGVRFKGNSSLRSTWQSGNLKLSFKLDFDEFEDDYPQIKNQRFYGFKKLSLKNNYDDKSFLREKVAADIFRNAGLASSHTAFYAVYVDFGAGPTYFGLYTMVEEVEDTVIDTQFSDNDGNLYKPDGDGASFANGSFDEADFEKESNEDEADWSDIAALFTTLHHETRTTDPASWRGMLDASFDTETFLKYLAVNTVIQNWDTYGRMTHNYFLYNNPETNLLTWIPWDNNEALQEGKMGGSLALDFSDLSSNAWPLIGYLYADEVYKAKYDAYVKETVEGAFNSSNIQAIYANYATLVEAYATSENTGYTFLRSTGDFQTAVNELNAHASQRTSAVNNYLE